MARYSKVLRSMWGDKKFRALSAPKPNAQTLWMRLLTGPELGPIPGLFAAWDVALAKALGWSSEAFTKAFAEVSSRHMAKADWEAGVVWIPNAIRHNEPANPNVIKSWRNAWDELPECSLKDVSYRVLKAWAKGKGKAWLKAFDQACGKPSGKQEQEQEQEQEERVSPPSEAPKRKTEEEVKKGKKTKTAHRIPEDWKVTEDLYRYGRTNERVLLDRSQVDAAAEDFRDHWANKPGKDGRKLDWDRAFQQWLRRQREYHPDWPKTDPAIPEPTPRPPEDELQAKRAEVRAAHLRQLEPVKAQQTPEQSLAELERLKELEGGL